MLPSYRFRCLFAIVILLLSFNSTGQTSFKDSLFRSNPLKPGSKNSLEEKINAHGDFLKKASLDNDRLKQLFGYIYLFSDHYLASDYEKALHNLLEAERIATSSGNDQWAGEIISRKAIISIRLEKPAEALQQFGEAALLFGRSADTLRMAECMEQMGATYCQMGDLQNAQKQYQTAIPLLEKYGTERQMRVALSNFGDVLVLQNQPDKAIGFFERALSINRKLGDREKEAQDLGSLGNAFGKMNQPQKALECFRASVVIAQEINMPEIEYVTYSDMAKFFEGTGDFPSAYKYYQKYHSLRDSVIGQETQEKIVTLQQQYEFQKKELELEKNREEILQMQQRLLYRSILTILALVCLGFLIYIILNLRQDRVRRAKIHESQQNLLHAELKLKDREQSELSNQLTARYKDLTDLALNITQKNDFIEGLVKRIEVLHDTFPHTHRHELHELKQFIIGQHQIDKQKALFQENINEINRDFFEKLSARFGDLSPAERDLCGLLRLNLSNKEIAVIKSISPNSAKIARYRLRKRLQLDEKADIISFLQAL